MTKTKTDAPIIAIGAKIEGFVPPAKPERGGGSKPKYPFDELANVGDYFGVKGKNRRQMAGPINSANKRFRNELKAPDGSIASVTQEREFYAVDVDAETAKALKGTAFEGSTVLLVRSK